MLCVRCAAIFENLKIYRNPVSKLRGTPTHELQVLHPTFASLEEALKDGCGFCHRLVHATKSKAGGAGSRVFSDLRLQPDIEPESFTLKCRFAYETDSKSVISCYGVFNAKKANKAVRETCAEPLFLSPDQTPLTNDIPKESRSGGDAASIAIIESWVERCINSHSHCNQRTIPRPGPRFARILDVGGLADATHVRLRRSEELPEDARYMTLSHCWGGLDSRIPCLTTVNHEEYFHRILVESLPATFRDTIELAHRLSIQFVWIDSLCIIQNSTEDWLEQAAIMGEVYHGAYLNVAATRSSNPTGGLFFQRNPVMLMPLRVGIRQAVDLPESSSRRKNMEDRQYTLDPPSLLTVVSPQLPVTYDENRLDLNSILGNSNGEFCLHGESFALSARNVHLYDSSLHADLRTTSGEWRHSSIDLRSIYQIEDPTQSILLEGSSTLVTRKPRQDTEWKKRQIDLNEHIGVMNGRFDSSGTDFEASAKDIVLTGRTLSAHLQDVDGEWHRDSFDISNFIHELEQKEDAASAKSRPGAEVFFDVGTDYYAKWSLDITRANLCKRGWVLQERLLAPRIVHFGKQQMYFECTESCSVEQDPKLNINRLQAAARNTRMDFKSWDVFSPDLIVEPQTRPLGANYVWSSVKAMFGRHQVQFAKEDVAKDEDVFLRTTRMCYGSEPWRRTHPLIRYWSAILITYKGTSLTYEDDRLLAIAGLAKILSQRTGIAYVAGLWNYQLPRQLLWNNHDMPPDKSVETIDNGEAAALYIAPSWSPLSCKGLLGEKGIGLDPILEANGAMDLIKVMNVNVKGNLMQDNPPFGRLQQGRLRLRGRLLPISLNFNAWPEGEDRPHNLVQGWAAATRQLPTGEVFLIPVVFTRWNDKLPSSTPNSLLLESTQDAGVFRRIGVARLSSRYPLRQTIPQLYLALSSHYKDEDDDADSEREALKEDIEPSQASQQVLPNPQQELADTRREFVNSPRVSKQLNALQKHVESKASSSSSRKVEAQKTELIQKLLTRLQTGVRMVKSESPGNSIGKMERDTKHVQKPLDGEGHSTEVTTRNHHCIRRPAVALSPKKAVGEHFYLEYKDDEDTARYGHFVFEVI